MVLQDQEIFHHFHKDEMGPFSHQVNGQSLANLKDVLNLYKNVLKFSYYMSIDELKLQ